MEEITFRRLDVISKHLESSIENCLSISETSGQSVISKTYEGVVTLNVDQDGIGVITMNSPPVNALGEKLLGALNQVFQDVQQDNKIKAVVITGKDSFCGGADISLFTKYSRNEMKQYIISNNNFLNGIENGNKPVVAAIHGFAYGGGCEVAMACHYRVCTSSASLGLPELTLGVIPGFGGTQRLPRLVGIEKAVEMMLTSAPIKAQVAHKLGLVDAIVNSKDELVPQAVKVAKELASKPSQSLNRSLQKQDKVDKDLANSVIYMTTLQVQKTTKNVKHPYSCLNAIIEGILHGPEAGLKKEGEEFDLLIGTDQAISLQHLFFASKQTHKIPDLEPLKLKPRSFKAVAVIGGGTMGSGIATALLTNGITVHLKEVNQQFLDAGVERIKDYLRRRVESRKMTEEQFNKTMSLLIPKLDYSDFDKVDMAIEAVIEDLPLKQRIFEDLEKYTNKNCILATNTSTIDVDQIGAKTKSQNRIIGTHFFSPAHVMQLLEIVRTKSVSPQVVVDTLALTSAIKKIPVVVGNCIGFLLNRIFAPYNQAASFLLERGVPFVQVDQAVESFGMAMGPFRMVDLSGIDVFCFVGEIVRKAYSDRAYVSTLMKYMMQEKRLGQKTKLGFYKYSDRKGVPDEGGVAKLLAKAIVDAGNPKPIQVSEQEIVEMLLYPVVNEALRCAEEGIVIRLSDIDVGTVYSYGFPPYRGGVMKWAELEGLTKIATKMSYWHSTFGVPLFKPCKTLESYKVSNAN